MLGTHRVEIDATTADHVFTCTTDPEERWNGWATPSFDRANAERVIAMVLDGQTDEEWHRFRWEGDVLIMESSDGGGDDAEWYVDRYEGPEYPIGSWAWTWSLIPDDAPTEPEALNAWLADRLARTNTYCVAYNAALNAAYDRGASPREAIAAGEKAGEAALAR